MNIIKFIFWKIVNSSGCFRVRLSDFYYKYFDNAYIFRDDVQEKIKLDALEYRPLISIVMPVYNVDINWLDKAVNSVKKQFYKNWELCIVDDCSSEKKIKEYLGDIDNSRIKIKILKRNVGIAAATNAGIGMATGEYVGFMDHDDELTHDALYQIVKLLNFQKVDLIYSDEDKISIRGMCTEPYFKPDFSQDMLLSQNYINHFVVISKKTLDNVGNFRLGFDGSQDYDLLLRVTEKTKAIAHIPKVLYHWRQIPGSTATAFKSKDYAWESGKKAVSAALRRRHISGEVLFGKFVGTYRVKRYIKDMPLVSIIIPFRDRPKLLKNCLNSIIKKSTYEKYEILCINNQSNKEILKQLIKRYASNKKIEFLDFDESFNYSRINNYGVSQASGQHVILLNNDVEIISSDWIESLLEHSQRDDVGAVGAKLYYKNNTIQHAGIIVGIGGVAGHSHKYLHKNRPGYFCRPHLIQNLLGVTGACLMIKKHLYVKIGGMDDKHLAIAFNDMDLCLRLIEQGYLNVYTPYCELFHLESVSRGDEDTDEKRARFSSEINYMKKRHKIISIGDPYYNRNLTLTSEDFRLRVESKRVN